jgi:hypothetical protein
MFAPMGARPAMTAVEQPPSLMPRLARCAPACLIASAGSLLVSPLPTRSAYAMDFVQTQVSAAEAVLSGRGRIIPGDADRLRSALSAVPSTLRLIGLTLDSPGGNVAEAKALVGLIRARALPVAIPHRGLCASACFMLLAASPHRLAASDAIIGVHSAAENGAETDTSLAVTTLMARDAAELGVPPAIIGKMVETTPGELQRLNLQDLALMNVTVFSGDLLAALLAKPSGAGGMAAAAPPGRSGFDAGRADRRAWEAWLATLRGPYRDGVLFARARMADPTPGLCAGPGQVSRGDFTQGCEAARQRLAPMVTQMRTDAAYQAGWNDAIQTVAPAETVEQEYQGVYFCGASVPHLAVKLFPPSAEPKRRALLSFGPTASSPTVPRGAFLVEGTIDPMQGVMTLAPVKWMSQPPGYPWLGLRGASADGGKTWRGQVTDSLTCTVFTLQRAQNTTSSR